MKGISSILVVVMLVIIVVLIASAAFIWSSKTITSATDVSKQSVETTSAQMLAQIKINSISGNTIYIQNVGSVSIEKESIGVFIDNERMDAVVSPDVLNITANGQIVVSGIGRFPYGTHELKIVAGGSSITQIISLDYKAILDPLIDYEMDEGSGEIVADSSGNGLNGGVSGFMPWSTNNCQSGGCIYGYAGSYV